MTIYSLDVLLFLFGTNLFHVQFYLLLPDLYTGFSRGRSGDLVFPSLSEFSTVYRDPHSQYLGLISFRMDWFDLLAVSGTLKSLLQHHSSKASILQCSAFFMVQLSHSHTTTGKTIALNICTFVGKARIFFFYGDHNKL